MSKRWITFIWFVIVLGLTLCFIGIHEAQATEYVRFHATGDSSGSSWSNAHGRAALQTAESQTSRAAGNDTLWIAGGVYNVSNFDFDATVSGTNTIFFIHATAAKHGTATGWDDSLAALPTTIQAPPAVLEGIIEFETSYYTMDGQVGADDGSVTPYGFKVALTDTLNKVYGIYLYRTSNITLKYVELDGLDPGVGAGTIVARSDGIYMESILAEHLCQDNTISHCYFHDFTRTMIITGLHAERLTIEHSRFERLYSGDYWSGAVQTYIHHEPFSINGISVLDFTFRYNKIIDCGGTGAVVIKDNTSSHAYIYGNIVYNTQDIPDEYTNGCIFSNTAGDTTTSIFIYNNTIYDVEGTPGVYCDASCDSIYVFNNLWYGNATQLSISASVDSVNYNAFDDSTGTHSGTNTILLSSIPFADSTAYDFTLSRAVAPGKDLGSPYDTDPLGNTRTNWDMGAYEYIGASGWTGKINSVTNPTRIINIEVANISKINGIE